MELVKDHRALIQSIREQFGGHGEKPVAVALDTLNRSLTGSESKDEDMSAYVKAADAIREAFGCVVLIVHHCGIDGTRPRGHTSLTGAVDAQLAIKRDAAGDIFATVEWMKDGPEGAVIVSRLEEIEVGTDDDGDPITSCIIVPSAAPATEVGSDKLSPKARAGLNALHECLADLGRPAPASGHIPQGVACVTLDQWKERLLKIGLINHRQQFRRIHVTLQNAMKIGIWDGNVWASQSVTKRHM